MKAIAIIVTVLTFSAFSIPARAAQPKAGKAMKREQKIGANVIARYDKNGNGVIDADEVEAIQKAFKTDPALKQFDKNGDGQLDDTEVSAINPPPKKKKK